MDLEEQQDRAEFKARKDFENFTKNVDQRRKNVMLPKPPKPGEIMYCQVCRQAMLPKDFSQNVSVRKREFKWHIHDACMGQLDNLADRSTPGLAQERKKR